MSRQGAATELASVAVAQQQVLSREGARLVGNAPEFQQPDDGRDTNCHPRGMNEAAVVFFCGRHAFQDEDQRAADGSDVNGLVGSIQYEHRFLQRPLVVLLRHKPHPTKKQGRVASG
jgi:hypothetical protein